jgi:hypothetical protein
MVQDYRCDRCHHLLFKGSLQLLQTKQHDPNATTLPSSARNAG